MAASVEIAGRDVGIADAGAASVADCVPEYRTAMRGFARRKPPRRLVRADQRESSSSTGSAGDWARRVESCSPRRSPRHAGRTSLRAVRKLTEQVTASRGSGACRPCSFRSASCSTPLIPRRARVHPRDARRLRRRPRPETGAICLRPTDSSTWRARSSASAASARGRGYSSSSVETDGIRSSCR